MYTRSADEAQFQLLARVRGRFLEVYLEHVSSELWEEDGCAVHTSNLQVAVGRVHVNCFVGLLLTPRCVCVCVRLCICCACELGSWS